MLAIDYRGSYRVCIDEKPMPKIEHPRDAIAAPGTRLPSVRSPCIPSRQMIPT